MRRIGSKIGSFLVIAVLFLALGLLFSHCLSVAKVPASSVTEEEDRAATIRGTGDSRYEAEENGKQLAEKQFSSSVGIKSSKCKRGYTYKTHTKKLKCSGGKNCLALPVGTTQGGRSYWACTLKVVKK